MEFILVGLSVATVLLLVVGIIYLQNILEEVQILTLEVAFKTPDAPVQNVVETPEEPEEMADLSDVESKLTPGEIARIERELEFDTRIAQIKEELALRNEPYTRRGTEAVVLHPNVHNLPHTAIPEFSDELPDVEITY